MFKAEMHLQETLCYQKLLIEGTTIHVCTINNVDMFLV